MEGRDKVVKAVFDDVSRINQSVPKERYLLYRALRGERLVPLKDGSEHLMEISELEEFASALPSWMRWVVKVPLMIAYNPLRNTFKVLGSEWDEKAIRKVLGLDRDEPIRMYHLEKLIMRFGSLIFVLFEVDMSEILRGDEHGI